MHNPFNREFLFSPGILWGDGNIKIHRHLTIKTSPPTPASTLKSASPSAPSGALHLFRCAAERRVSAAKPQRGGEKFFCVFFARNTREKHALLLSPRPRGRGTRGGCSPKNIEQLFLCNRLLVMPENKRRGLAGGCGSKIQSLNNHLPDLDTALPDVVNSKAICNLTNQPYPILSNFWLPKTTAPPRHSSTKPGRM